MLNNAILRRTLLLTVLTFLPQTEGVFYEYIGTGICLDSGGQKYSHGFKEGAADKCRSDCSSIGDTCIGYYVIGTRCLLLAQIGGASLIKRRIPSYSEKPFTGVGEIKSSAEDDSSIDCYRKVLSKFSTTCSYRIRNEAATRFLKIGSGGLQVATDDTSPGSIRSHSIAIRSSTGTLRDDIGVMLDESSALVFLNTITSTQPSGVDGYNIDIKSHDDTNPSYYIWRVSNDRSTRTYISFSGDVAIETDNAEEATPWDIDVVGGCSFITIGSGTCQSNVGSDYFSAAMTPIGLSGCTDICRSFYKKCNSFTHDAVGQTCTINSADADTNFFEAEENFFSISNLQTGSSPGMLFYLFSPEYRTLSIQTSTLTSITANSGLT